MSELRPEIAFWHKQLEEGLGRPFAENQTEINTLAALGFVNLAWRHAGFLEVIHEVGVVSDPWIMRANISTFRAVRPFFDQMDPDWDALQEVLEDPWRKITPLMTVGDVLDPFYEAVANGIACEVEGCRFVEEAEGPGYLRAILAGKAADLCKYWFGAPWWPDVVQVLLHQWDPPAREDLSSLLLDSPELLPDDDLFWAIGKLHNCGQEGFLAWRKRR